MGARAVKDSLQAVFNLLQKHVSEDEYTFNDWADGKSVAYILSTEIEDTQSNNNKIHFFLLCFI